MVIDDLDLDLIMARIVTPPVPSVKRVEKPRPCRAIEDWGLRR
jgi:hypothetical protein